MLDKFDIIVLPIFIISGIYRLFTGKPLMPTSARSSPLINRMTGLGILLIVCGYTMMIGLIQNNEHFGILGFILILLGFVSIIFAFIKLQLIHKNTNK